MKRIALGCLWLVATTGSLFAQQAHDVLPGEPAQLNGIDYGFDIRNESRIDIGGDPFMRYEVTVYTTNKSNCSKVFFPKPTFLSSTDPNQLAEFDCLNATGKRLTNKSAKVLARPFTVPYQQKIKTADGKDAYSTATIQAGYVLRNGETVSNSFIAIVPDGEKPRMKVRINEIPDL